MGYHLILAPIYSLHRETASQPRSSLDILFLPHTQNSYTTYIDILTRPGVAFDPDIRDPRQRILEHRRISSARSPRAYRRRRGSPKSAPPSACAWVPNYCSHMRKSAGWGDLVRLQSVYHHMCSPGRPERLLGTWRRLLLTLNITFLRHVW